MGKKSLYAGIILIIFPLFYLIEEAFFGYYCFWDCWVLDYTVMLVIGVPLMIKGILLLRKYFRTRDIQPNYTQNKDNLETKRQELIKKQPSKSDGKTQFWVCPVCNNDLKDVNGKSYCENCERYI